jgi:hypothetical protein
MIGGLRCQEILFEERKGSIHLLVEESHANHPAIMLKAARQSTACHTSIPGNII